MPKKAVIAPLIGTMLILLLAFAMTATDTAHSVGRIRIPEADIDTEIYIEGHEQNCGCCPSLWNGGIVTTTANLASVQIGYWADIVTIDGGHYVCECVEIIPCVRVRCWLIGWWGVVKADGDIVVFAGGKAYRLVRL